MAANLSTSSACASRAQSIRSKQTMRVLGIETSCDETGNQGRYEHARQLHSHKTPEYFQTSALRQIGFNPLTGGQNSKKF
jgi:hypothetical protein